MQDSPVPDDDVCGARMEYFAERLNLVFSYFFCTLEFEEDDDLTADPAKSDRAWMIQTIQTACLHCTLVALRDLDDFLGGRKTKPDDMRASDFGFSDNLSFLSRTERDAINKGIAHTTLQGVASQGQRWDIFELLTKAVAQADQFLKAVQTKLGLEHFVTFTAALVCERKTRAIYDHISRKVQEKRAAR
jgi:hypothetical protein